MQAILVVRAIRFAVLVHPTASLSSVCCLWQWLGLNFDVWRNKVLRISPLSPWERWVRLSVCTFFQLQSLSLCMISKWLKAWGFVISVSLLSRYGQVCWDFGNLFFCNTSCTMVRGHLLQSEVRLYSLPGEHQVGQRWLVVGQGCQWKGTDSYWSCGYVFSILEKSLYPHIPILSEALSFRDMSLLPELMQLVNRAMDTSD